MIRINLLPVKAAQKRERFRGQVFVAILVLALTGVACAGYQVSQGREISTLKADGQAKQTEINMLKRKIGEVGKFKKLQKELRGKLDVLEQLKAGRTGPTRLLDDVNRALPEKVWLTSFKLSGNSLSLSGISLDEERVASFMRSLLKSPRITKVNLKQTAQVKKKNLKLQKFSLSCSAKLSKAGGA